MVSGTNLRLNTPDTCSDRKVRTMHAVAVHVEKSLDSAFIALVDDE